MSGGVIFRLTRAVTVTVVLITIGVKVLDSIGVNVNIINITLEKPGFLPNR